MLNTPLTIEAIGGGTITVNNWPVDAEGKPIGMKYSINGGEKIIIDDTDEYGGTCAISVREGDKVAFYGEGTKITCYGRHSDYGYGYRTTFIQCSEYFNGKVYGNIMSLVDEDNFATATTLPSEYTFSSLFNSTGAGNPNLNLMDASGLVLPATTLTKGCYSNMFIKSGLNVGPKLPATTLAESCYEHMFDNCYYLKTAPELPAKTLVKGCYSSMFNACYKLRTVTCLATDISAEGCIDYWLGGYAGRTDDTYMYGEGPVILYVDPSMTSADWQNGNFEVTAISQ
jgi:hypothetical protein